MPASLSVIEGLPARVHVQHDFRALLCCRVIARDQRRGRGQNPHRLKVAPQPGIGEIDQPVRAFKRRLLDGDLAVGELVAKDQCQHDDHRQEQHPSGDDQHPLQRGQGLDVHRQSDRNSLARRGNAPLISRSICNIPSASDRQQARGDPPALRKQHVVGPAGRGRAHDLHAESRSFQARPQLRRQRPDSGPVPRKSTSKLAAASRNTSIAGSPAQDCGPAGTSASAP